MTIGDQPNIVLITSDDQTKVELKWMPQTRRLLGKAGLTFNNMIAPHPNCCPARAQILSGEYAHNNGVRTNSPPWGGHEGFDPTTALPLWLQAAGYRTGFIGKYMHGYDETDSIEPGWDQWKPIVGILSDYRSFLQYDNGQLVQFGETDYYTDVVAQQVRRPGHRLQLDQRTLLPVVQLHRSALHLPGQQRGRLLRLRRPPRIGTPGSSATSCCRR